MSIPPEQINIKRRREEEPVETLYIQSELHQTKRRFTDFVFQRVQVSGNGSGSGSRPDSSSTTSSPAGGEAAAAPRRILRTPRSASSLRVIKGSTNRDPNTAASPLGSGSGAGAKVATTGVPLVRATSPGAEIREENRLAAARREKEEKLKRALHSSPIPPAPAAAAAGPGPSREFSARSGSANRSDSGSGRTSPASATSSGGGKSSLRRFQITRPSNPVSLHRSVDGGIQKRRRGGGSTGGGSSDGVAVLVEKLRRKPHSRQASMVAGQLAAKVVDNKKATSAAEEPVRARKRPVVNQAEKKWREERKNAISAAKQHISHVMDKGAQQSNNWDDESDRLARSFEQIALELDDDQMEEDVGTKPAQAPATRSYSGLPKSPLKYQPRTPNKPRPADKSPLSRQQAARHEGDIEDEAEAEDRDGDYVYDVYIRKPLPETGLLSNPLADLETDQDAWFRENGIDTTRQDIGVIVITQEDEGYWENFIESGDEEQWDSEDADSNAEDNPANDYPDEELSWNDDDDDDDDFYGMRQHRRYDVLSDDEDGVDFDDSASEGMDLGMGRKRPGGFGFDDYAFSCDREDLDDEWD